MLLLSFSRFFFVFLEFLMRHPLLLNCAILLQALTAFLIQMVERQQGIVTDVVGAGGVEGGMRLSCGGKRGETLGVVKVISAVSRS